MTLTIDLTPAEELRLAAVAQRNGMNPAEAARLVLTASLLPAPEQEQALLEEWRGLREAEDAGALSDTQAARLRWVAAELDHLEDLDPVEQEADRRQARIGDKLDEILALLQSLPRNSPEERKTPEERETPEDAAR